MAEDKRSAPGDKPRRRHTPQIDLTATEIKPEPAPEKPAEPQPAQPEQPAEPPQATESPQPTEPPQAAEHRQPVARAVTYAAIAAALIAAAVTGGAQLWMANKPVPDANAELNSRLAALETQLRAVAQRPTQQPAPPADNRPLEALTQRIAKLEEAASKPAPAATPDTALNDRVATVESSLASLNRSTQALQSNVQQRPGADAIDALTKRLDAVEQNAKSTQDKIAQNTGADAAARQALVTIMLRDAVLRGTPFTTELAAMRGLNADPQATAALEPFAASGIPSEAALGRELAALLPSMITASKADPARSGGFLEKLEANAEKLVRIRPVGEPSGNDPAAALARIEVKLARNDVAGAEKDLAALPEKARQVAEPWRKKFAARTAALEASRKLGADSAAALAR